MQRKKQITLADMPNITLMLRERDVALWLKALKAFKPTTPEEREFMGYWLSLPRFLAIPPDAN
ncbi:MAG TPA: hypothetical protein VJ779_10350 [Acetobacteraceae bacterium]|nr:hypothetical protein [Acetobacteraceae bacterium]